MSTAVRNSVHAQRAQYLDSMGVKLHRAEEAHAEKDKVAKKQKALEQRHQAQEKANSAASGRGWSQLGGALLALGGAICCCIPGLQLVGAVLIAAGATIAAGGSVAMLGKDKESNDKNTCAGKLELESTRHEGAVSEARSRKQEAIQDRRQRFQTAMEMERQLQESRELPKK